MNPFVAHVLIASLSLFGCAHLAIDVLEIKNPVCLFAVGGISSAIASANGAWVEREVEKFIGGKQ